MFPGINVEDIFVWSNDLDDSEVYREIVCNELWQVRLQLIYEGHYREIGLLHTDKWHR